MMCKPSPAGLGHAPSAYFIELSSINPLAPHGFPPSLQAQAVSSVWKACILSLLIPLVPYTSLLAPGIINTLLRTMTSAEIMMLHPRSPYFHEHGAWHTGWCSAMLPEQIKGSDN